jgi:TRAP-type C4-dicarboxylate transport system substrate-binding protein
MLTAWGLKLVLLDEHSVIPAFQSGTVSVAPWTQGVAFSKKAYTKARYMSDLVWSTQDQALVIDKRVWNQIPSSWRANLLSVSQQFGKKLHNGAAEEAAAIVSLQGQGVQVTSFTESAAWYAQLEASYATLVRGRLVSASVFDSALQILKDYRATH